MRALQLFIIITGITIKCFAQCPEFVKSIGDGTPQESFSVIKTFEGGLIISGSSNYNEMQLIKTDSCGVQSWTKLYDNGGAYDAGKSVIQTSDSGYLFIGTSYNTSNFKADIFLVKTNKDGDTLWTRIFGTFTLNDMGNSVIEDSNGDYVLIGSSESSGAGMKDVYLVKMNSAGNTLFERTYGGANDDSGNSLDTLMGGGYVVFGETKSYGPTMTNLYLIKLNSLLDTVWTKVFGGADEDFASSVKQTPDSGFIAVGSSGSFTTSSSQDIIIIKTDKNGIKTWQKIIDNGYSDSGNDIDLFNGGYIIAGSANIGGSNFNMYAAELNSSGTILDENLNGGTGQQFGNSVSVGDNMQYYVAGTTDSTGNGDFYLVKYQSPSTPLSVREQENLKVNIYPTLSNGMVYIKAGSFNDKAGCRVYNSLGAIELSTVINTSNGEIPLNISGLKNGIYFISVESNSAFYTQKILLIK
jgi:hypothetical protein